MKKSTMIKVLNKTKDKLIKYGWIQRSYGNKDDGYCLSGALNSVTFVSSPTIIDGVGIELQNSIGKNYTSLASWNDKKNRTKKQVLALIDKTIKRLQNEK